MINDEFKYKKISRQRRYQLRKKLKGLCIICGEKAVTSHHCEYHAEEHKKRVLAKYYENKGK